MKEDLIREIAARACREALQEKARELAEDVAQRMGAALASLPDSQPSTRERTKELCDGTMLIAGSRTQTETLETLLAGSSAITSSCVLMVVRGGQATGWSCNGLNGLESFKHTTLDCSHGIAATVINSCTARAAHASELDPAFVAKLRLESSAEVLLVPVSLKERVAAILVALGEHSDDLAGLELLVQVAQLTLELHSYRKAAPQPAAEPPRRAEVRPPIHEPAHAHMAPATHSVPATAHTVERREAEPVYATSANSFAAREPAAAASSGTYPSEMRPQIVPAAPVPDEAHVKARRFAKLLVEEIKLYNQTKVAEGRARGDLYSRLREDIEKSRAAYQKRYGENVRDTDYFTEELVRILADNNRTVMGAGFPG